jgi:DNA mismatch endonuclease (patch repair protein)
MADFFSKEQRSLYMAKIKSTGTKPEQRLYELLFELIPDHEIVANPKNLPGKPDAWIPDLKMAIFADGCFFHCCPIHGHIPKSNTDYWESKLKRNKARDRKINKELKELGFKTVRIWEHQLQDDLVAAKRKIKRALKTCSNH